MPAVAFPAVETISQLDAQPLGIQRLLQEVEGAELRRFDGLFDRSLAG
jgi:hypothetical protein